MLVDCARERWRGGLLRGGEVRGLTDSMKLEEVLVWLGWNVGVVEVLL